MGEDQDSRKECNWSKKDSSRLREGENQGCGERTRVIEVENNIARPGISGGLHFNEIEAEYGILTDWKDEYSVGIVSIDRQNRKLIVFSVFRSLR